LVIRQQRQGVLQHGLLVGQPALATVVQGHPGQRDGAATKRRGDHQDVVVILNKDTVDHELHPLTL
jgi:hypothetical protein